MHYSGYFHFFLNKSKEWLKKPRIMATVPPAINILSLLSSDFLISVIFFPLPNNLSIFLFTEFAFLFDFHTSFFSSVSQGNEGNNKGECTWGKQGLRSRQAEELFSILPTILSISIQLLLMKSLLVSSLLPLFTVSVLFYRTYSYFQDHFHLRDRQCGSDKHHHQPQASQYSKHSVMLLYFTWVGLCICLFQTRWENKVP